MEAPDPARAIRPLLRARQVREFTPDPVEQAQLDAIADAGRWSGSSANRQPWRFVLVRDRHVLDAMADAGMPSTRSLATAPAAIVIVLPDAPGGAVGNAFDEGRAAERMLLAASLLGLGAGIAWIGKEARPLVAAQLGLPEDRFVRTVLAIGHPTAAAQRPKAPRGSARLPRQETVFEERWPES